MVSSAAIIKDPVNGDHSVEFFSPLVLGPLMKNMTRRPPLIIHSGSKQSQRGLLETKVEADSPFTASQYPTPFCPWAPVDFRLTSNVSA